MSNFEASVTSLASATYIHSHRSISDLLAGEHPEQGISMLAELGNWLPQLPAEAYDTNVILLLLQSLEFWIPNINLMTADNLVASREGLSCLYHLTSLTLRYSQSHAEQILVLYAQGLWIHLKSQTGMRQSDSSWSRRTKLGMSYSLPVLQTSSHLCVKHPLGDRLMKNCAQ